MHGGLGSDRRLTGVVRCNWCAAWVLCCKTRFGEPSLLLPVWCLLHYQVMLFHPNPAGRPTEVKDEDEDQLCHLPVQENRA